MERIKEVKEIKLLPAFVLVEIFDKRETKAGIMLPENSKDVMRHGVIIGRGKEVPEEYAMGDIVLDYNQKAADMYVREDPDKTNRKFMMCSAYALKMVIDPNNFDNSIQPVFRGAEELKNN